ncbi:MAG: hypothetical protein KAT77_01135 [Nanoarchaeota archaeon]|nr:hypothetical protein [Nanoarchaeota archaeon]
MNKKASLNMAIEVIVIVVIAMTLLGLGLGFVRNQFSQITETTSTVQEQIKQQILDDLRVGNKKLSFPTEQVIVQSGDKKNLAVGVQNLEDRPIKFKLTIQSRPDPEGDFGDEKPKTNAAGFFWDNTPQTLGLGESRVYGILHQAETSKNTYLYKVVIEELDDNGGPIGEYDSKSFFVTVT